MLFLGFPEKYCDCDRDHEYFDCDVLRHRSLQQLQVSVSVIVTVADMECFFQQHHSICFFNRLILTKHVFVHA
jgi:hypothetical protein